MNWPRTTVLNESALSDLGLTQYFGNAGKWLDNYIPFQEYLTSIENSSKTDPWNPDHHNSDSFGLGIFELPRSEQVRIAAILDNKDPMQPNKDSKKIDEDSVNGLFISILSAITIKHPDAKCIWTPHRVPLQASFNKGKMEAHTDGYLMARNSSRIRVIIEVKPNERESHETHVSMQETAEIVAWIKTERPQSGRWVRPISPL